MTPRTPSRRIPAPPSSLQAALRRLHDANEFTKQLDAAYNFLKLIAEATIAARNAAIAARDIDLVSAQSVADLLHSDLSSTQTALAAREAELLSDRPTLAQLRLAFDSSEHQCHAADARWRQSHAEAQQLHQELARYNAVIAEQRLTHLFYGVQSTALSNVRNGDLPAAGGGHATTTPQYALMQAAGTPHPHRPLPPSYPPPPRADAATYPVSPLSPHPDHPGPSSFSIL